MALSSEDTTSLIALIIALIALTVSSGQLVQAIFGTANGYRRCQESVMGEWAAFTRLKWRWSLFSFETRFCTPHFSLENSVGNYPGISALFSPEKRYDDTAVTYWLVEDDLGTHSAVHAQRPSSIGGLEPLFASLSMKRRRKTQGEEKTRRSSQLRRATTPIVTWANFINAMRETLVPCDTRPTTPLSSRVSVSSSIENPVDNYASAVAVGVTQHVWDFLPADTLAPLATIRLGDLVAIGHRLGMKWQSIDLGSGVLQAQGSVGSFSSTLLRGLGVVLHFEAGEGGFTRDLIPSRACDDLGMGRIGS
ncbi:Hypothetical protein D9617_4g003550 [Elsinoe fawcettii]|nr:Hypothetical protein D9617_4g003550 [Elsinoe fawcettii]